MRAQSAARRGGARLRSAACEQEQSAAASRRALNVAGTQSMCTRYHCCWRCCPASGRPLLLIDCAHPARRRAGDAAKLDRFDRRFVWFKTRMDERKEVRAHAARMQRACTAHAYCSAGMAHACARRVHAVRERRMRHMQHLQARAAAAWPSPPSPRRCGVCSLRRGACRRRCA